MNGRQNHDHINLLSTRGFTLIELLLVITIVGILGLVAIPKFLAIQSNARINAITMLYNNVQSSMQLVNINSTLRGGGTVSPGNPQLAFMDFGNSTIRMWNGYPDRWWDGVGMTLLGAQTVAGGGYSSTAVLTSLSKSIQP